MSDDDVPTLFPHFVTLCMLGFTWWFSYIGEYRMAAYLLTIMAVLSASVVLMRGKYDQL